MSDAQNIGAPPKKVKDKDRWTWRIVKNLMKRMKSGDETGFTIGRTHWILRKGNFSK